MTSEPNKIMLSVADCVDVSSTTTYTERAKALLESAINIRNGKRDDGYGDDKYLATSKGIEALIGAGAEIIKLNAPSGDNHYLHAVRYEGHQFIAGTDKPFAPVVLPCRR